MTQAELGKRIAELRKQAGYTQQSLADALFITDKAVSKWERGLCSPDSAILSKLAGLLDTDLATLIPDSFPKSEWKGLLIWEDGETGIQTLINGKPLIHYLLSYFLLLEITEIEIRGIDQSIIKSLKLEQYGFHVSHLPLSAPKTMVVCGKTLLFGAYLSIQLKNMMSAEENTVPIIDEIATPILFLHDNTENYLLKYRDAKKRSLYRGIMQLPLDTMSQIEDADFILRVYEKNHHVNFCDLHEIAINRGLISK